MRFARTFAVPLLLACATLAVPPAPAAADGGARPSLAFEKTKLANGLEVIVHEDHRAPIVSVNLWYHVGSKDEAPGRNGFAHLFEHVMFQGSKHVPEDTFFRFLEKNGATDINGTTNSDRTNYFETVPKNRLELALWLESDRMGFLLDHVDELTFTGQRDVVKNERRQNYENAAYGLVSSFVHQELYPADHPYRLLTIGTPEDLDRATLEDVKSFFRQWYVPNNATLVVAGDVEKGAALALVQKYFGGLKPGVLPPRKVTPTVWLPHETILDVAAGVELARVVVSWPTPAMFEPGDGELDLVARVLAAGKTSRLYKRLVYDLQIATDVSAYQSSGQLGSQFEIVATAHKGHTPDELLAAIDAELARLAKGGVEAAELQRAKTATVSQMIFDVERSSSRANLINTYNQLAGDPAYFPRDLARYEDATADALKSAVVKWLPLGRRIVTRVTPRPGAPLCGEITGKVARGNVADTARGGR